jgi:hypothetical protein
MGFTDEAESTRIHGDFVWSRILSMPSARVLSVVLATIIFGSRLVSDVFFISDESNDGLIQERKWS